MITPQFLRELTASPAKRKMLHAAMNGDTSVEVFYTSRDLAVTEYSQLMDEGFHVSELKVNVIFIDEMHSFKVSW